jgi:hypothetical protein
MRFEPFHMLCRIAETFNRLLDFKPRFGVQRLALIFREHASELILSSFHHIGNALAQA